MQFFTDLHLHSRYSRAVSPQMNLEVMAQVARQKGLDILSAADFTFPLWFKELNNKLIDAEEGLYELREEPFDTAQGRKIKFMLSTEISSIYKQGDRVRRVHNLIFVPSLAVAEKFNKALVARGANISSDGRPIVGISSRDLLELLLSIDERAFLIPAHIWTPHFGVYGSASGFDSLTEAYGDLAPQVFGIETGLSSDPEMNWQVKELQTRSILSFSDAHSAPKMGREATVVDLESLSYTNIRHAFERLARPELGDTNKIAYTLEFYPEEGKYHFSGHRKHNVVIGPEEIRASGNLCPVCKRRMTEGVLFRVEQLSGHTLPENANARIDVSGFKWYQDAIHSRPPYLKLVPLLEIAAESVGTSVNSQKAKNLYTNLCRALQSEMHVLLRAEIADIAHAGGEKVAQAISKVRAGDIEIEPGYDGVYGKVSIWQESGRKAILKA